MIELNEKKEKCPWRTKKKEWERAVPGILSPLARSSILQLRRPSVLSHEKVFKRQNEKVMNCWNLLRVMNRNNDYVRKAMVKRRKKKKNVNVPYLRRVRRCSVAQTPHSVTLREKRTRSTTDMSRNANEKEKKKKKNMERTCRWKKKSDN